jgi:hypothetical protein
MVAVLSLGESGGIEKDEAVERSGLVRRVVVCLNAGQVGQDDGAAGDAAGADGVLGMNDSGLGDLERLLRYLEGWPAAWGQQGEAESEKNRGMAEFASHNGCMIGSTTGQWESFIAASLSSFSIERKGHPCR